MKELGGGAELEATERTDFRYSSEEVAEAVEVLASYVYQYECAEKRIVEDFKRRYTIHGELVDQCAASLPDDLYADVSSTVTESLVKVQRIDIGLRLNTAICTSLRVELPESCIETRRQYMASLADITSDEELERINLVVVKSSESVSTLMQACLNAYISH